MARRSNDFECLSDGFQEKSPREIWDLLAAMLQSPHNRALGGGNALALRRTRLEKLAGDDALELLQFALFQFVKC